MHQWSNSVWRAWFIAHVQCTSKHKNGWTQGAIINSDISRLVNGTSVLRSILPECIGFTDKVKYKEAVTYWLDTLGPEFYCTVIHSFVPRWDKCQWSRFGVDISYTIRVSFMYRLQTKFSASEGCLIFLLFVLLFVWWLMAAVYTRLGSTLCFTHDTQLKSAGFYYTYVCIY